MTRFTKTIVTMATLLSLSAPRPVFAQAEAIAPQHNGSVEFLSGGVGETERAQIRAQASSYNLKVVTATPSGAYIGSTDLMIADEQSGKTVVTTHTRGPLFYARLPEGRYVVTARNGSQVQQKTVRVGSGASPEVMLTLAAPENKVVNRAAKTSPSSDPNARARVQDQGVSLYDLDPGAADRARAQVNRYEVYPDGTKRPLAPNEVPTSRSIDAISDAVTVHVAPVEPGGAAPANPSVEPAPAPAAAPRY